MIESTRPGSVHVRGRSGLRIATVLSTCGLLGVLAMLALPALGLGEPFDGQVRAWASNARSYAYTAGYSRPGAASAFSSLEVAGMAGPAGAAAPAACSSLRFANPFIYPAYRQPGSV